MGFEEIDAIWIILGIVALGVVVFLIINRNTKDPLLDKLNKLKLSLVMGGIFFAGMYVIIPHLGAFDYPYEAADVDSPEKVLKYLQKQNDAIVKLTDIIRWTFFIIVTWMIIAAYQFLHAFGNHLKNQKAVRNNENDN